MPTNAASQTIFNIANPALSKKMATTQSSLVSINNIKISEDGVLFKAKVTYRPNSATPNVQRTANVALVRQDLSAVQTALNALGGSLNWHYNESLSLATNTASLNAALESLNISFLGANFTINQVISPGEIEIGTDKSPMFYGKMLVNILATEPTLYDLIQLNGNTMDSAHTVTMTTTPHTLELMNNGIPISIQVQLATISFPAGTTVEISIAEDAPLDDVGSQMCIEFKSESDDDYGVNNKQRYCKQVSTPAPMVSYGLGNHLVTGDNDWGELSVTLSAYKWILTSVMSFNALAPHWRLILAERINSEQYRYVSSRPIEYDNYDTQDLTCKVSKYGVFGEASNVATQHLTINYPEQLPELIMPDTTPSDVGAIIADGAYSWDGSTTLAQLSNPGQMVNAFHITRPVYDAEMETMTAWIEIPDIGFDSNQKITFGMIEDSSSLWDNGVPAIVITGNSVFSSAMDEPTALAPAQRISMTVDFSLVHPEVTFSDGYNVFAVEIQRSSLQTIYCVVENCDESNNLPVYTNLTDLNLEP